MLVRPVPIPWCNSQYPRERCFPPPCQTIWPGYSRSHSICLGALDGIVCRHGTPVSRSLRLDRVMYGGSRPAPKVGLEIYSVSQCAQRTGSVGGGHGNNIHTEIRKALPRHQDRPLDIDTSPHSKRDVIGGLVMAQLPLPTLQHRAPKPPSKMQRVWFQVFYLPCPGFQKRRPCHDYP